jgi:exopolyphosphatase/guanosine-5'-triphosphate,3'-diphosphate pyrophosphatase
VRYLALQLYDQLGEVLGCTAEERALLEAAALLHDVGQLVSYRRHHKHSYQLIMHADRLPLSPRDRAIVAAGQSLSPEERAQEEARGVRRDGNRRPGIVRRISGPLRLADGLDRGHTRSWNRCRASSPTTS